MSQVDLPAGNRDTDIRFERRGAAAWITLNRPEELNSMSPALLDALDVAITRASEDPEVLAVVVTGAGRGFCAGADLKFLDAMPPDQRDAATAAFLQRATTVLSRLEAIPKPVIAAVNGVTVAGGLELVLCCDLVLAAAEAKIGDGHANYGLLPGAGASVRLPRKIGVTRAKYLFFTGELQSSADLAAAGLVNRVVPLTELVASVGALVATLATKSPLVLRRMKALADDGLEQSRETALRNEQIVGDLHSRSYDRVEGVSAFKEKRKPEFKGK